MHVLLVCRSFPHHRPGGMEWHCQDIAEGLMDAGHTVSIITSPLPETPALKKLAVNGKIYTFGKKPGSYGLGFFTDYFRQARRVYEDCKPDIIHAQGYAGIPAQFLPGNNPPLVTTIHGTLWSETLLARRIQGEQIARSALYWQYRHRFAIAPFWKLFLRKAQHLIVDSQYTVEQLGKEVNHLSCDPTVVPLGIGLDRYPLLDRQKVRHDLGIGENELLLFAIGRLEPVKAPDKVLESFLTCAEEDPRLHLIIAGTGKCEKELRNQIKNHPLGKRVQLPGKISPEKVSSLYAAADLFLNADLGNPAFGLTNAEALCYGTPVLTTPAGAHSEVITTRREGSVLPIKKWQSQLPSLLKGFPEREQNRQERQQQGRLRFDRKRMLDKLVSIYESIQG
jgi:phosphatidyl-myo-inositol alpha-mannosyltransferase